MHVQCSMEVMLFCKFFGSKNVYEELDAMLFKKQTRAYIFKTCIKQMQCMFTTEWKMFVSRQKTTNNASVY